MESKRKCKVTKVSYFRCVSRWRSSVTLVALTRTARVSTVDELHIIWQRDDESIDEQGGVARLVKSSIDDVVVDAKCKVAMN